MLKVFLVEDEIIVRQGLRDNMPWNHFGYEFVGEASDGEMALSMIERVRPDVLLTDIKMPFMDGLTLSKMVHQKYPDMKIIILSGHDDFEYAQEAINVGVDQYILKPITKIKLQKVLLELKDKIESEQVQRKYQEKFLEETKEYEQYSRSEFFVRLFEGHTSLEKIYEEAERLGIRIQAPCYNLFLFSLQEKRSRSDVDWNSNEFTFIKEELFHYFLKYPEHQVFRVNMNIYGVLALGSLEQMEDITKRCIYNVTKICEKSERILDWYLAYGEPVERISLLAESYNKVNHYFTYRFILKNDHVLDRKLIESIAVKEDVKAFDNIDAASLDPDLIKNFLSRGGGKEEVGAFVGGFIERFLEVLQSKLFQNYLLFHVRFTAIAFVESIGLDKQDYIRDLEDFQSEGKLFNQEELIQMITEMLIRAIDFRDTASENQGRHILKKALEYIDANYMEEMISLNEVAQNVNVSSNYFSALFSKTMKKTFVEYVTQKRMDLAKKLLRTTPLNLSDITNQVGYKDPHYFSFVFKKTQGISPREYRAGGITRE